MFENHHILVIDDTEAIHLDFRKVLGADSAKSNVMDAAAAALFDGERSEPVFRPDYQIDSAYQGQQGLAFVQRARQEGNPYALAFVDVRMPPGWDGIETSQRLWEADEDLQIVLCTAYSDYSWTDMVHVLGETDRLLVVKKPFDNIEIRQIACALTKKWSLVQQVKRHVADLTTVVESRTAELAESNRRLREKIADQRRAAQFLQETEARTSAIIAAAADGIITIDELGVIESVNPAAERMFGYAAAEALGKNVSILVPAPYLDQHSDCLARYRASGCGPVVDARTALEGRRKDGAQFPLELAIREGFLAGRRWFAVTTRDMTQQKRLEAQLLQSQKLEAIGQLAAGVAHEINTPIQFVGDNLRFLQDAFAQLLAEYQPVPPRDQVEPALRDGSAAFTAQRKEQELELLRTEAPEAIAQSLEGIKRVAGIVAAMKQFSHPGTAEKVLADINQMLESTLAISINEWKFVAEVVCHLAPDLPPVHCVPGEINQVFLNLIVNAAHAVADALQDRPASRGRITVTTRSAGRAVEILISDTGAGIPERNRSRIFDPFFTTKDVGRGTGQGLAIARSLVCDKHGGSIVFETEEGVGTTFVVRLPVASNEANPLASLPAPIESSRQVPAALPC